jgi:hypothetical protein
LDDFLGGEDEGWMKAKNGFTSRIFFSGELRIELNAMHVLVWWNIFHLISYILNGNKFSNGQKSFSEISW